jgi:hypothetical protein
LLSCAARAPISQSGQAHVERANPDKSLAHIPDTEELATAACAQPKEAGSAVRTVGAFVEKLDGGDRSALGRRRVLRQRQLRSAPR